MNTLSPPLSSLIGAPSQPSDEVRFDAVEMRLGGQQILRNITLSLKRGETVAIVGESGCGKTTLLKLILGLLEPSKGRIIVLGKDIATMDNREQSSLRRHFGFLFQAAALFDSMNVSDNIAFGLRAQGILRDREILPIIQQKLAEVGLAKGVASMFPAELSGGMRKRVGLARALALNPEFMLFDEPTTGLDPIMSDVINDLILKVKRNLGITAILVTHEMQTVRKVADRVIMLAAVHQIDADQSQILFDGPVAQFLHSTDPRIRRFIEGNAGGLDSPRPVVPVAHSYDKAFKQNIPVPEKDSAPPLRWIVPQILAPTMESLPILAKTHPAPTADATVVSPPKGTAPVPEKPVIPLEPIEVEAQLITVAPASLDLIPGQFSLNLASSPIVQDWELGKEFLPEPKAPAEPTPVAASLLPPPVVDVDATMIHACPLPLENGPESLTVALAKSPSAIEPWNLGEEFLGSGPIPSEVVPFGEMAPADNRVESPKVSGERVEPIRFEDSSLATPSESVEQVNLLEEPFPPMGDQVPLLDEPRTDSMVLEEAQGRFLAGEADYPEIAETPSLANEEQLPENPNASLEQSP